MNEQMKRDLKKGIWYAAAPGKTVFQIKEFSRKKMSESGLRSGFAVEFLEGDNDWPAVMKAVDEIGYRGWATAEPAWQPPGVEATVRLQQISEKVDRILAL